MQIALVTGANKGIGYEVALSLSTTHNFHVLLGARDQTNGEKAASTIKNLGGSVEYVHLDVSDDATIHAVKDFIEKKHGKLDVLINNAGITGGVEGLGGTDLRKRLHDTYDVNVFGPALLNRELADLLGKSDNPRIVNVSSTLGSLTSMSDENLIFRNVQPLAYNSSKSALNALTVIFAYHLKSKGIKVNSVDPGYTSTDLNGHQGLRDPKDAAESVVRFALIDKDGPTGRNYAEDGSPLAW